MNQGLYNTLKDLLYSKGGDQVDATSVALQDSIRIWVMLVCDICEKRGWSSRTLAFVARVQITPPLPLLSWLEKMDGFLLSTCHQADAFKQHTQELADATGHIFDYFLTFCQPLINGWFCRKDVESFRDLHQILAFPLRITLDMPDLEEAALCDYSKTVEAQQTQDAHVGEILNATLRRWFPREWEPSLREFRPHHGPGVTSTTSSMTCQKNARLDEVSPLADYYIRSRAVQAYFPSLAWFLKSGEMKYVPKIRSDLFTKIIFVPKNWKKKRTISAEPVTNLYLQEAVKDSILGFIRHPQPWERDLIQRSSFRRIHPLKKRYTPEDQEHNRALAWEGSLDGSFATIDLSSASDSVSLLLVRNAFRHCGVLPALLAARTPRAMLPNGTMLDLTSYGPMGNALTFPIETIIFCACCEVAIQSTGDSVDKSRYVVYGDDIVIEGKYVDALLTTLSSLDFKVNSAKSFWTTANLFRESCGAEWLQGENVCPVRIPRGFKSLRFTRRNPGLYSGMCTLANELYAFPMARRFVIDAIFSSVSPSAVPFSPDGELGLFSTHCTNFQLEWKETAWQGEQDAPWWVGLQRPLAKIWTPVRDTDCPNVGLSEASHYFNWLCQSMLATSVPRKYYEEPARRPWVSRAPTRLSRRMSASLYLT